MDERIDIDLNPVSHITADAIGPKGQRVFYIQGWHGSQIVTLIVEKVQIHSLSAGVEKFLDEIQNRFPNLSEASPDYEEDKMHIHPPVEPLFRVGEIALGYDSDEDMVVLVARQILSEDTDPEEAGVVRYWCSRSQLRAMSLWGLELVSRGRPICPQCGQSEEPEGHFCPKKNGHKH